MHGDAQRVHGVVSFDDRVGYFAVGIDVTIAQALSAARKNRSIGLMRSRRSPACFGLIRWQPIGSVLRVEDSVSMDSRTTQAQRERLLHAYFPSNASLSTIAGRKLA